MDPAKIKHTRFNTRNMAPSVNTFTFNNQLAQEQQQSSWGLPEIDLNAALGLEQVDLSFTGASQPSVDLSHKALLHDTNLANIFSVGSQQQRQQQQQQQSLGSPAAVVPDFDFTTTSEEVAEEMLSTVGSDTHSDYQGESTYQEDVESYASKRSKQNDTGDSENDAVVPRRSSRPSKLRQNRKYSSRDTPRYNQRQPRKRNPPINLAALDPAERKRIEEERLEKNRQSARDCRLRKKAYIQGLEQKVAKLSDDLARAEDRENDLIAEVNKLRALLCRK